MNERVLEIAKKASDDIGMVGFHNIPTEFTKKFAELLLQECLLAISKTPKLFTEEEVAVMIKCHDHVEEHFGVEDK